LPEEAQVRLLIDLLGRRASQTEGIFQPDVQCLSKYQSVLFFNERFALTQIDSKGKNGKKQKYRLNLTFCLQKSCISKFGFVARVLLG